MNELIGYRCWRIKTFRSADTSLVEVAGQLAIPYVIALTSMTRDDPWAGPVMHADHKPSQFNGSGLYSFKNPRAAAEYDRGAEVTGAMSLYGHIVEHRNGYRAEHAMLRSLTIHVYRLKDLVLGNVAKQIAALAHVLERRYQCDVLINSSASELTTMEKLMRKIDHGEITVEDLAELAKRFGQ